jgi:hypothetical protein
MFVPWRHERVSQSITVGWAELHHNLNFVGCANGVPPYGYYGVHRVSFFTDRLTKVTAPARNFTGNYFP